MSEEQAAKTSFLGRLGKAFARLVGFCLRLLFTLVLGAALGVGIFYGAIFLYRQYIEPVQVHEIRLDVMDARRQQEIERSAQRMEDPRRPPVARTRPRNHPQSGLAVA